jgi:PPOX class probable F420-dependent enzyme
MENGIVSMTTEEIDAFLSQSNNAIVGVNRAHGAPQLTVVWYAWDGKNFYFSTTKDRAKYLNIQRDPSISIIVDDFASHRYLAAYGKAEIVEENSAELVWPIVKKYMPAERVEQAVENTVSDPNRVIVVLHPEKILTN